MSTEHGINGPVKIRAAAGAPVLAITFDGNGNTIMQGPLDNFRLCDRMLDDAKRIVLEHHIDGKFVEKAQITRPTNEEVNRLALVRSADA